MIPWGAIISLAGTAASGIMSKINNDKMKQEQDAENARQQAYYAAKAAENPLARSENQQVLNQYDRKAQQQVENARNVAAITGATPEYALAVQKNVAQGRADLMSDIAAGASERADKYNEKAEQARHQQSLDEITRRQERNQTYAALASNAANAFGSIVDSYAGGVSFDEDAFNEKKGNLDAAKSRGLIDDDTYNRKLNSYQKRYDRYLKSNI